MADTLEPADASTRDRVQPTSSFEAWYEAEHARLVGVVMGLGADTETAADLVAEAFCRALERWDRVRLMASPSGWTVQVALNLLRRRERRRRLEERFLASHRRAAGVEAENRGSGLWEVVRTLPPRQRTAIVLHYVVDLPYHEVAALMGISEGAVGATLTAARHRLEHLLREPSEVGYDRG